MTSSASAASSGSLLHHINIRIGQFCFRSRNALFPCIFAMIVLLCRPAVLFGSPVWDQVLGALGALVAVAGELIRLTTIGFEYIERGGREGKVYASRLVQGGMYAHSRNPMYVGNALIAIGMTMVSGAPSAYLLVIPFFLYVYQAIVVAEEAFLRGKFGAEYEAYCARVPRFLPSPAGLRTLARAGRYQWKRAIRQDLSTIIGLLLGLVWLPVWRVLFLHGRDAAMAQAPRIAALTLGILALYGALYTMKKRQVFNT